jgi:hypothetical protein
VAAACAFAAATLAPASATAGAPSCTPSGYSYAGLLSDRPAHGVSARITALSQPIVHDGHVAAWVGVGGEGLGPDGTNEWLQVGISAEPGNGVALYYELALPNVAPKYVMLKGRLDAKHSYHVAVLESKSRPGWWSVWVDGTRLSEPAFLPGSHGVWRPIATTESWAGGVGACNAFAFKFANLSTASKPGGGWGPMKARVLQSPGFQLVRRDLTSFVAGGGEAFRTLTAGH